MTKLCPRGKAAAKRKFKVYPSAYANAYASKICAGKIKDPSGVKRKDFKGPKPAGKAEGGRIYQGRMPISKDKPIGKKSTPEKPKGPPVNPRFKKPRKPMMGGGMNFSSAGLRKYRDKQLRDKQRIDRRRAAEKNPNPRNKKLRKGKYGPGMMGGGLMAATERLKRQGKMGGGMMQMPRAMYGKGGGVCKRGMGRAYGKNS